SEAKNQPWQLECARGPRDEDARLREKTEQPAKIKTIGPIWNFHLLAREKPEGGPDAVDRRPGRQSFAQIIAELFLWPTADRYDHMGWFVAIDAGEQGMVFNRPAVDRRNIKIVLTKLNLIQSQPFARLLPRAFVRQNPKCFLLIGKQPCTQRLQIL